MSKKTVLFAILVISLGASLGLYLSSTDSGEDLAATPASGLLSVVREPASRPPSPKKKPSNVHEDRDETRNISDLQRESLRSWRVQHGPDGRVTRLMGGAILMEGAGYRERARGFLRRYAQSALGIRANSLVEVNQNERVVRYQQMENGALVWNSKISIFFDEQGNIVHVVSEVQRGRPPSSRAVVNQAQAADLARSALESYVAKLGGDSGAYAGRSLDAQSYLYGEGNDLRWMYRFVTRLDRPLVGEVEILVDGSLGQVFSARNLARR